MFKRIFILTFSALFLLSTTGLPLTLHFCKMKKAENSKCSMCSIQHTSHKNVPEFKRDMSGCCKTTVIKTEVKDNFLTSKTQNSFSEYSVIAVLTDIISFNSFQKNFKSFDTSPPLIQTESIYIINSVLII